MDFSHHGCGAISSWWLAENVSRKIYCIVEKWCHARLVLASVSSSRGDPIACSHSYYQHFAFLFYSSFNDVVLSHSSPPSRWRCYMSSPAGLWWAEVWQVVVMTDKGDLWELSWGGSGGERCLTGTVCSESELFRGNVGLYMVCICGQVTVQHSAGPPSSWCCKQLSSVWNKSSSPS